MDESSSGRKGGLILLILVAAAIVGGWFLMRQGAIEAVDETVDVFVPDADEMDRRTGYIDEARRLTEAINAR